MNKRKRFKLLFTAVLSAAMICGLAACGGGSSQGGGTSSGGSSSGGTAGTIVSFETVDLDGNPVSSADIFSANKVTMINVWGTFCGPCVKEMPEIQKLSEKYASQGAGVIGLICDLPVGDDTNLADAKDIIETTGVKYLNIRAWEGSDEMLPSVTVPTTYFVDSEGRLIGEKISGAKLKEYGPTLEKLLAEEE